MKAYAVINKDKAVREKSSSGGFFSAITDGFDVIYGAAMTDDQYGVEMVRTEGDISSLRGSKYMQAKAGDTFRQVKKDLQEGKKVLFTGTGCQINGLSLFLQKDYPNLLLVDVICHGAPSSRLWKKYAEAREAKLGKLNSVNFRCKDTGWSNYGLKENSSYIPKDQDPYMNLFLRNYALRPSCYECPAKALKRSDITMGDFWGIDEVLPDMNDEKGTSLIIIRTQKGQEAFDHIQNNLRFQEVRYQDGVRSNTSEYSSVKYPEQRNVFYQDLEELSFADLQRKYLKPDPLWKRAGRKIKRMIKSAIQK